MGVELDQYWTLNTPSILLFPQSDCGLHGFYSHCMKLSSNMQDGVVTRSLLSEEFCLLMPVTPGEIELFYVKEECSPM